MSENPSNGALPEKKLWLPVLLFMLAGLGVSYLDEQLHWFNLAEEGIELVVIAAILGLCIAYERRFPDISRFGWRSIVIGVACLAMGSIADILDEPPVWGNPHGFHLPLGPSWQLAYIEKMLGSTLGISLFAYGFFRWIPWMIGTRLHMQRLNERITNTNRKLNRTLMSLDEHVESERVSISRELHDDVAQQLTFINVQLQLCRRELETGQPDKQQTARERLHEIGANISEALKSVRQISGDLRPESLYSLGLIHALEHFIEKLHHQNPDTEIQLTFTPLTEGNGRARIEETADDKRLLHLFRVIQEGVRNAIKHAAPRLVRITLEESRNGAGNESLRVRIEDDGPGLPWPEVPPDETLIQQGHLGIVGLKERVRELSGRLTLANRNPGPGTRLEIIIE